MRYSWEYSPGFEPEWLTSYEYGDNWTPIHLPHRFNEQTIAPLPAPKDGRTEPLRIVTLRKRLPPQVLEWIHQGHPLTFASGKLSDVSQIYLNGKLLSARGALDPYASGLYRHHLVDLPQQQWIAPMGTGPQVTSQQSSSQTTALQSLWEPGQPAPILAVVLAAQGDYPLHFEGPDIVIGHSSSVYTFHFAGEIFLFSLISIYMVVGFYHILLAIHRPKERYNLYFGLFAVQLALYFMFRTYARDVVFGEYVLLRIRTEYVTVFSVGCTFPFFVSHLFRLTDFRLAKGLAFMSVVCALGIVTTPYGIMRIFLSFWQFAALVSMAFIMWKVWQAYRSGTAWARPMIAGFVVLFIGAAHDIMASQGLMSLGKGLSSSTFMVFVLGIAQTLASRFTEVSKNVEELNINLDRKVRERTEELLHAKDAAEESNRAKSTFLAHLSHEIRTPMHGILGMTDILLESEKAPERQRMLEVIRSTGKNFLHLLNDALDLAKIDAGRMEIHAAPFHVRQSFLLICEPFALRARGSSLTFQCRFDEDVPTIAIGDVHKIRQVLTNLLSNAFKFTPHGFVEVIVENDPTQKRSALNFALRVRVRDSGVGVPGAFQSHIFESFAQADSGMSRKYGGTGLGTTIALQLTRLMGGKMGLVSPIREPDADGGPGSEFWFTLNLEHPIGELLTDTSVEMAIPPLMEKRAAVQGSMASLSPSEAPARMESPVTDIPAHDSVVNPAPNPAQTPALSELETDDFPESPLPTLQELVAEVLPTAPVPPIPESPDLVALLSTPPAGEPTPLEPSMGPPDPESAAPKGWRVLVAEDNSVNQLIISRYLKTMGHSVEFANDGQEAVEKALGAPFDLVLMDIQMPYLNGYEAAQQIRAAGQVTLPILALTANAFPDDVEMAVKSGMNGLLAKPCTRDELRQAIDKQLGERPVGKGD